MTGSFKRRVPVLEEDGGGFVQNFSEESGERQMCEDDQGFLPSACLRLNACDG